MRRSPGTSRLRRAMAPSTALGIALAALVALPGRGIAQEGVPEPVELPAALDRVLRDYEVAWRGGDEDALAALFTPDGFVLSGPRPPARGAEAIRTRYADAQGDLHLVAWDWSISGDVAFIIGGFAVAEGQAPAGKYVLTLKRDGDRWLIHSDMDGPMR